MMIGIDLMTPNRFQQEETAKGLLGKSLTKMIDPDHSASYYEIEICYIFITI